MAPLLSGHWDRWYNWRYSWLILLLLADWLRIIILIALFIRFYSSYYLLIMVISLITANAPTYFLLKAIPEFCNQSCCRRVLWCIPFIMVSLLELWIEIATDFIRSWLFAATDFGFPQRKRIVGTFISFFPKCYKLLCQSKDITEIKYKILSINYALLNSSKNYKK